ncbi:MAG: SRPBCC family protein [Bdellovibrionota bacterium]
MKNTRAVRHITVSINRSPTEVYAFASKPENLPKWASGLGGSIKNVDGEWIADSPMGKIKIRFAKLNDLGVLDHEVILESGEKFQNPMRVVANGEGSEVTFTLFRQPDMTDEKFEADAQWVEKDLATLKSLLER